MVKIKDFNFKEYVTSPRYPEDYQTDEHCGLTLQILINQPLGIQISLTNDECAAPYCINSGSASSQSFVNCQQYDGDKVLHTTNVIYSNSPKESVHIVLAKNNSTGFNISIQGSL